jgi:DNA-binding NarL/FixJ family response regulator
VKTRPRIFIADDHPLVAHGLRRLLLGRCDVPALVHDPRQIIGVVARHTPDVLLLDLSMPHLNGLEALALVRDRFPALRVVVVTMHLDRTFADLAFAKGAHGFAPKSAPPEELWTAIAAVMRGERYCSPTVPRRGFRTGEALYEETLGRLTPRQCEILRLIGEAKTSARIAADLGITPRTLAFHRAQLRRALGITHEAGLVEYAVAARLSREGDAPEPARPVRPSGSPSAGR